MHRCPSVCLLSVLFFAISAIPAVSLVRGGVVLIDPEALWDLYEGPALQAADLMAPVEITVLPVMHAGGEPLDLRFPDSGGSFGYVRAQCPWLKIVPTATTDFMVEAAPLLNEPLSLVLIRSPNSKRRFHPVNDSDRWQVIFNAASMTC